MIFLVLIHLISLLSLVLFFIRFKMKKFKWDLRLFVAYLFLICSFDLFALWIRVCGGNTSPLYNLLTIFEFNVLFLMYGEVSRDVGARLLRDINLFIFNVSVILTSFYFGRVVFLDKFNNVLPVIGALQISVLLMLFLREFLLSEEILNYKRSIYFWITTGLLLYYLGTLPLTVFFSFMKVGGSFVLVYKVQNALTILMHICFIIGGLWSWNKDK
ncbi:hypothetical protein ACQY1Q_09720 [Tenacibaculum sp. TC6]